MSKAIDECVESILTDNPDYSKSRAFAICNAMANRNELGLGPDATHDELIYSLARQTDDCPDGQVRAGDGCVPVVDVTNAPPSVVGNTVFELADIDTEPIERIEEGENTVRYKNLKLLSPGVWTDSASRETVWYSPRGMKNLEIAEDNVVNIMHDADNEVSEAGTIDPESVEASENGVFADVVIDTSTSAGRYADDNLQKTLETEGAKGFGGPSVEISAEGQEIEFNAAKGMKELVGGIIDGLGLVKNPASKPVSFARQTAKRGVALSDNRTVMQLEGTENTMSNENREAILSEVLGRELQIDSIQDDAENIADELDVPVAQVMEVLDPLMGNEEEEPEEEETEAADDEEEETEAPEEEGTEEDEEEEEMDMETKIQSLDERLSNLEDMAEQAMAAEEVEETLSEELEATKEELASAETVVELEEAKEELDKRLSDLEDEPKTPRSLADNGEESETEGVVTPVGEFNKRKRTYSR